MYFCTGGGKFPSISSVTTTRVASASTAPSRAEISRLIRPLKLR
jgi:hypothetical protein